MIGADIATPGDGVPAPGAVFEQIMADAPCPGVTPYFAALCEDVTRSVTDRSFPGAVVPVIDGAGAMKIYVVASTRPEWRRLRPVLLAFAGPTLTSFDGTQAAFDETDPIARLLLTVRPAVTAVMKLPGGDDARHAALEALMNARNLFARVPARPLASLPTGLLLARFQDCLNGTNDEAADILERLRDGTRRLDALNIRFLEIQMHAAFRNWSAIVDLEDFRSLCVTGRIPAIRSLLLEALYQKYISVPFDAGDEDSARETFVTSVRSFVRAMHVTTPPPGLRAGGWRLLGLEALADPGRHDLLPALAAHGDELGWIADRLPPPPVPPKATGTMPAVPAASAPGDSGPPASWVAWLDRVADPAFTNALEIARQGKDEWEIGVSTSDPVMVGELVTALNRVMGHDFAEERTSQALPYLVAWLQRDSSFPRAALSPVYRVLLTLFALGEARGSPVYESSLVLIKAILASGLDQNAYGELIADVSDFAGDGFGVDMIYWVLELIESFLNAATPDATAREEFLHQLLARIDPLYHRLSHMQRVAVFLLSKELGRPLPEPSSTDMQPADRRLAECLADMRIAIYSLTESSSARARDALEKIAPTVRITTNADHDGGGNLRSLAENSDLFVVNWQSAKHAATEFIRAHRGDRPLIYSEGKGSSSIIRAVEEHLLADA